MKNYKLKKYDKEKLLSLGFYEGFPGVMEKTYHCSVNNFSHVTLQVWKGKEHINFYEGFIHFLPCELEERTGDKKAYKELMKAMKDDISSLKEAGIIK